MLLVCFIDSQVVHPFFFFLAFLICFSLVVGLYQGLIYFAIWEERCNGTSGFKVDAIVLVLGPSFEDQSFSSC